jgi:hypothetical protein
MKMTTKIFNFLHKNKIWIYGVLTILSLLAALVAVKNIKISPDSMRYALISHQILSGNGIRLPIIRLEDNYIPVDGAIPFLEQPPLLPIILAMLGGITPQDLLAAQVLNVICHVVIAVFTFLLMIKIHKNNGIALLTGVLVTTSFPLLRLTHHIWSETTFIAFTVTTMYFVVSYRHSNSLPSCRRLVAAGIFAAASILTRFAGISLISVFLWEILIAIKKKQPYSKLLHIILSISIPVITTIALLTRNQFVSGTIRGVHQIGPDRSYLEALTGTINIIFKQFQLGPRPFMLITIFVVSFFLYILISVDTRKEFFKSSLSGLDSIIIFIFSYTALITATLAEKQPRFELRYAAPLVPFLFIMTSFVIIFLWHRVQLRGFPKLSFYGIILTFCIVIFGNGYKTFINIPEFFYIQEKAYSLLKSRTYNWINEHYQKDVVITTNRPYHLSFFGGYTTLVLPHKRFDPNIRVIDKRDIKLPNRMSDFGSRVLVLFEEAEEKYDGRYLTELFSKREDRDSFILSHEFPDGVVYELKD